MRDQFYFPGVTAPVPAGHCQLCGDDLRGRRTVTVRREVTPGLGIQKVKLCVRCAAPDPPHSQFIRVR